MSGEPHDLLDRDTRLGLFEDCCIGILTSQIALVLDTLGGGQQVGIDGGGANCSADVAHGFANRIEEGVAGVLHEMPTIGDLGGVRKGLGRSKGVTPAAVACDHSNLRLPGEPGLRSGRLSVG